jgi:primosomal protein N' (replication factor Y)
MAEALYAVVAVDAAIDKPLDYLVPEDVQKNVRVGMRVSVPIRGRLHRGVILELKDKSAYSNVKAINALLEDKLIPSDLMQLGEWMARYYVAPFRKVMKVLLPPSIRKEGKHKTQKWIRPLVTGKELTTLCETLRRTAPQQAQVLDLLLKSPKGMLLTELLEKGNISRSPIDQLVRKKLLVSEEMRIDRSLALDQDYFQTKAKILSKEQTVALDKIVASLEEGSFVTHLLFGVTGSGKTEVYLQAIERALQLGKGVILLVPEIALTSQIVEKVKSRFEEKVALLHYRLSDGERHDAWHKIRLGEIPIVIGARSAIFSPIKNLGLILVDEEHESSYKQTEESPCYHARDVAVMRGKMAAATVVLGSATPSLESYTNALLSRYQLSELKERADTASLPKISIIDMRHEFAKKKGFTLFSDALLSGIEKRLAVGEQTLLFLNRRGYHTSQMCTQCSHVIMCPHCDLSLTYHLGDHQLACHLCDYRLAPPPRTCPECGSDSGLKYKGAGTEMVERALHALFPELRTLRLDADTTRHKGSHELLFKQFRAGKADVLIGTQMIAKGLHFPSVTLVSVLNADAALNIPDFRSSELAFQLITQVAGRSGRGRIPGEVLIQTHLPEHTIMQAAVRQDYVGFYKEEAATRKLFEYPPFAYLAKIVLSGTSSEETHTSLEEMRKLCIRTLPASYQIHPTAPCGYPKVKTRYRFQFLIKGKERIPSLAFLSAFPLKTSERLLIDIDPLSTFF